MAPKANALITVAELDLILRITIGNASLSDMLINIASDFIDNFTNRNIISQTYTDQEYDGNNDFNIYLRQYPVTAVTTVKNWDTYGNVLNYTFTEFTEYINYLDEGYIYLRGKTVYGHKNYRITYTAGYITEANVPYDLKNACAQLAGLIYFNTGKSGVKSESIGKYSITFDKSSIFVMGIPVPVEISGVINKYRNYNI